MKLTVEFEFEVSGTTDSRQKVSRSGQMQLNREIEPGDYCDDGMLYLEAIQSAMENFWTFAVEKADHHGLSDVTITIRNLNNLTNNDDE